MKTTSKTVGAFDAKTHLSQYLNEVQKGERIEITRRGKPVAVLVPVDSEYPTEAEVDQVVERVRERSKSYHISLDEIQQWKNEGRA